MTSLSRLASAHFRHVRRLLSRRRYQAALVALVVALIPASVIAAEMLTGDEVIVAAPVSGDLYIIGSDVLIEAAVDGDVLAAGGRVQINGPVTGSVHVAAGDVIIHGDVGGSIMATGSTVIVTGQVGHALRAAASEVLITNASIDGDVVIASADLTLSSSSVVNGEIIMRVGTADLAGEMNGGLRGSASTLRIRGAINAPSDIRVNSLRFMDGAVVTQPFAYSSDHEMLVDGGTTITGHVTRTVPQHRSFGETIGRSLLFALFRFGWGLATGWLLLKYVPQTVIGVSETLRLAPGRSLLWGLLGLIGAPLVAIVAAVSVIGVPVAVIIMVLYVFALYCSQIVAGMAIGGVISRGRWQLPDGRPAHLRTLAAGLAIVALVRSIPLDGWYPLVALVTATIALGAIVVYFFRPRPPATGAQHA